MGHGAHWGLSAAALAAFLAMGSLAQAADVRSGAIVAGSQLSLNCENGRTYPIKARAVSDAGELVTGYLYTAPRRAAHFRLIPMGNGYRYSGHGFWFDGVRGEATLELGGSTNCMVAQD